MNITGPQKEPTRTGDLALHILAHFRHVDNRGSLFIYGKHLLTGSMDDW